MLVTGKHAPQRLQDDLRMLCILDVRVMRAPAEAAITKEELERNVEIFLMETETLRFFDLPTVMISTDSEEAEKVMYVLRSCRRHFVYVGC